MFNCVPTNYIHSVVVLLGYKHFNLRGGRKSKTTTMQFVEFLSLIGYSQCPFSSENFDFWERKWRLDQPFNECLRFISETSSPTCNFLNKASLTKYNNIYLWNLYCEARIGAGLTNWCRYSKSATQETSDSIGFSIPFHVKLSSWWYILTQFKGGAGKIKYGIFKICMDLETFLHKKKWGS